MKPGYITMILRTKDSLWKTATKNHQHLRNEKTKAHAGKVMWTVFWNSEGNVLTDFLGKGAAVNSILKPYKKHHEGGRNWWRLASTRQCQKPHISFAITDAIAHLRFTVLPHAAYSPDSLLVISNCSLNRWATSGAKLQFLWSHGCSTPVVPEGKKRKTF